MKTKSLVLFGVLALPIFLLASTTNPVNDFKIGLTIPSGDKILKWAADINGDGRYEVFLSLKSDFDSAVADHDSTGWHVYIAENTGSSYWRPEGIELTPGTISLISPDIDTDACYVGQITQLGKSGVVTMRIKNPRSGESVATIHAYTIEGDHLKSTQLAQYQPGVSNAVFDQYLKENVRTRVQLQEIDP
jgi:hypothetical protein